MGRFTSLLAVLAVLGALGLAGCSTGQPRDGATPSLDAAEAQGPADKPARAAQSNAAALSNPPAQDNPAPAAQDNPALRDSSPAEGQDTSSRSTKPAASGLPPGVPTPPGGSNQLVTVLVPSAGSTSGTLQAWQRAGGGWTSALGPVHVRVGTQGIGATKEGLNRTPKGTFDLPSAFGRQPNPGTKMPYRHVDNSDWWVSDPHSPAYNTYRRCAPGSCSFSEGAGENLGRAGASYDYAVVIGYNTAPVRAGAGSAFFVHVDAGAPSAGCVETPRATEIALLRWLDPAQHPRITIGRG